MEYLLGSVVTLIVLYILRQRLFKIEKEKEPISIKYSQTHVFQMVKPFLDFYPIREKKRTQTSVYEDKMHVRVILMDQQAYWILNNVLFVADEVDGEIDKETTRPVDTINMDKVQLEKMIFIVETLTEGEKDEDWDTRNKGIR